MAAMAVESEISPNDVEWVYEMRRVMQEILPRLFLGPYASGKRREDLRANNITHIMIVRSAIERIIAAKYPDEFKYHIVEIPASPLLAYCSISKTVSTLLMRAVRQGVF